MIIDLERKVQPVVKCVRCEMSNISELLQIAGEGWSARLGDECVILELNDRRKIHIAKGEYLVNDQNVVGVLTVNDVLTHYNYIDFEQGQQLEYDLEASVEARRAFFNKVKDFFDGE